MYGKDEWGRLSYPNGMSDSRTFLILFGSETGTAEDTAECVWREARRRSLQARLLSVDEYNIQDLPNELAVIIVMATSGQGEIPGNARRNWRHVLRRSLPLTWLNSVNFAVLALGDSSYQKFNFAGKKWYRRLCQLGGSPLLPLVLADEQDSSGIEGAVRDFTVQLFPALSSHFPNLETEVAGNVMAPPKFLLLFDGEESKKEKVDLGIPSDDSFHSVTLLANERVTAEHHFQDTRLVSFETNGNDHLSFSPGDVVLVQPCNLSESVAVAISALEYSSDLLDRLLQLQPTDPFIRDPTSQLISPTSPLTLRLLLERVLDVQQRPRRSFFYSMFLLAENEQEKERLAELASPAGEDDYLDYIIRPRRTIAETLRDFPETSRMIPPERLFDLLPRIRPRAFSIASCPHTQRGQIQILVAKTARMAEPRRGLCSTFLARLAPGEEVLIRTRPGTFKFPSVDRPLIAVGPGTGVAPFRSLFQHRASSSPSPASSLLFFGCRGRLLDDYCSSWAAGRNGLFVHKAYSREEKISDSDGATRRRYVQDVMREKAEEIWQTIGDANGVVCVAGSSGDMPKQVSAALNDIAKRRGWPAEAKSFSEHLEGTGRLQFETWA